MDTQLVVSSSPHIRGNESTQRIMLDVIIALLPALAAGVYFFGYMALVHTAITVAACVLAEYITRKILKRDNTVGDLSAIVTGMLLAFNLPVGAPWWMGLVGGPVAIVIVKQFFGGIGQNFMNPALAARVVLLLSFPALMTVWREPLAWISGTDAVTSATPMALLKMDRMNDLPSLLDMFLGQRAGCIGETSVLALLIGAGYLVYRKVINPVTPFMFVLAVALFALFARGFDAMIYNIMGGGLILGAFFMATDYSSSPLTTKGKVIFGLGCGVITAMIRMFGSLPEGVSFSILIMNILVPHIDRATLPKVFGGAKK
ncbi:MAG TPA: RnfABCDGE type electron transport complex subunit D [Clostridia bacterium]|nr:RnfABCDGE type electron transport complex subunit D [Clostridia bacterium]